MSLISEHFSLLSKEERAVGPKHNEAHIKQTHGRVLGGDVCTTSNYTFTFLDEARSYGVKHQLD